MLNGNAVAVLANDELVEALTAARQVVEERAAVLQSAEKEMAAFYDNNCTTYDDFKARGMAAASPIAD